MFTRTLHKSLEIVFNLRQTLFAGMTKKFSKKCDFIKHTQNNANLLFNVIIA